MNNRTASPARMTMVIAALLLATAVSCSTESEDPAAPLSSASTTEEPTTSAVTSTAMTRRAVGIQIADAADPDKELGYFHADPEALAEMAAEYCSDLEQTDSSTAQANLEDELASYVQFNGGPGNKDPRIAAVSARLVLSWVEEAATEIVCPDLGSSKFLPEN